MKMRIQRAIRPVQGNLWKLMPVLLELEKAIRV
jgi:hypothetical protein